MDTHLASNLVILEPRGMLVVTDPMGRRIDCIDGTLWVTQDRDARDVVLERGETFVFDRPRRAIVQALGSGAALAIGPGAPSAPALRLQPAQARRRSRPTACASAELR